MLPRPFMCPFTGQSNISRKHIRHAEEKRFQQRIRLVAFNRLGTIAAQRWGDMHKLIDNTWNPMQTKFFTDQTEIEKEALLLYNNGEYEKSIRFLTDYSNACGNKAVETAWKTGDLIWTVFDGAW